MKLPSPKNAWKVIKNSFTLFLKHDTFTHGAALSYYMVFSIAPILIIVISIAGAVLGPEAIHGEIQRQLTGYMSAEGAKQVQDIIENAYQPGKNWWATAIAIVVLIVGATSVFGQLSTALNTIWDVKAQPKKAWLKFILTKVFSMGMIACLAFLLLVSLVLHTTLEALMHYWGEYLKVLSAIVVTILDIGLSIGIMTLLFAVMYKYMSDAKIQFRNVWLGSFFTAILFSIGKYLIGLYIGKSGVASGYGAASSVVLILVWVFYSSQIVFFGAELTRALAAHRGVSLDPKTIPTAEETKKEIKEEKEKKQDDKAA